MSLPGETAELTALKEAVELFEDHWNDTVGPFNTQIGVVRNAVDNEHPLDSNELLQLIRQARSEESILLANLVRSRIRALCRSSEIAAPDNLTVREMAREIGRFYAAQGEYADSGEDTKFTSRGWTRGAVTTPAEIQVIFLKFDEDGFELNGGWPQTLRIRVDHPPGREETLLLFNSLRADQAGIDFIEQIVEGRGMPATTEVDVFDRFNTGIVPIQTPLVTPASATADDAFLSATELPGWTQAVTNRWKAEALAQGLRGLRGIKLDGSVSTTAADWFLTQPLLSSLDSSVPHLPMWITEATTVAAGSSYRFVWGGRAFSKAGTSFAAPGTKNFFIPALDKFLWSKNFAIDSPTVAFQPVTVGATDDIAINALTLLPGTYHEGLDLFFFVFAEDADPLHETVGDMINTIAGEGIMPKVINLTSQILEGQPASLNETVGTGTEADP